MTVHQLTHSLTAEEYRNWSIYLRDEQPDAHEYQLAILSNMVVTYMGKKNSKYTDFLIRGQKRKPQGSNLAQAFGAIATDMK